MQSKSIENEIGKIIENSSSPDTIDVEKVYLIVSDYNTPKHQISDAIRYILKKMESDPKKGIICVELLQLMNSMAVSDIVLSIICSDDFTNRCKSVIDMESSKGFKQELLRFIQDLAIAHQDNDKYNFFFNFYEDLLREEYPFPQANFGKEAAAKSIKDKSLAVNDSDADLNRAIQLSLEQSKKEKSSHYPPVPTNLNTPTPTKNISGKVLFSFKAEEPGELTIKAGDIVTIIDQCNSSWWKGSFEGKTGLFPSNFVTFDLSAPITEIPTPENTQIDEKTLEVCLSKLLSANPVGPDDAEDELIKLEDMCQKMKSEIQTRHNFLHTQENKYREIDSSFQNAINNYKKLMENSRELNITSREPQAQPFINTHPQYSGDLNDENLPIFGGDQYYQNPPQPYQFFSAQNSQFQPPFTGEQYAQNPQQQYGYPYYPYPPTDQPPNFISGSTQIPNYSQKKE